MPTTSPTVQQKTQFAKPTIQPKLQVNEPGDRFELEADRMADHIMRMPQDGLSLRPSMTPLNGIQRKCTACEEEEEVQRKPLMQKAEARNSVATEGLSSQLNGAKGRGRTLARPINHTMNQAFGYDFSGVRIHTDSQAVQMSERLNARAFTYGTDVFFNQGEYNPNSSSGKRLLAHELTHVLQQGGGKQGSSNLMVQRESKGSIHSLGERFWTYPEAFNRALQKGRIDEAQRLIQIAPMGIAKTLRARLNNPKDALGQYFKRTSGTSKEAQKAILATAEQKINPKPKPKRYKAKRADGTVVLLTEAEFKKLQRANRQLNASFREITLDVQQRKSTHQLHLQNQGLIGKGVDWAIGIKPPPLAIWSWPDAPVKAGLEALAGGDSETAVKELKKAKRKLLEAKTRWDTYISEMGEGGKKIGEYSDKVGDKLLEGVGVLKGAAAQVTEVADTMVWVGETMRDAREGAVDYIADKTGTKGTAFHRALDMGSEMSTQFLMGGATFFAAAGDYARAEGWVDKETGHVSVTGAMAGSLNEGAQWLEQNVGRGKNDAYFTPLEIGEIEGALGTQVALLFGPEEVKLAVNFVGILGSIKGVVEGYQKTRDVMSPAVLIPLFNIAISLIGLKSTVAKNKIFKFISGLVDLAPVGPLLLEIYEESKVDESTLSEEQLKARDKRIRQRWSQVVQIAANAIMSVVKSKMDASKAKLGGSSHDTDSPGTTRNSHTAGPHAGSSPSAPRPGAPHGDHNPLRPHTDHDSKTPLAIPTSAKKQGAPTPQTPLYKAQPPKRRNPHSMSPGVAPEGGNPVHSDAPKFKTPKPELYKAKPPKPKKSPKGHPTHQGRFTNKADAERHYFETVRINPGAEFALMRNKQTGEFRLIYGDANSVTIPKDLDNNWEIWTHNHPVDPRTNAVHPINVNPSGFRGDFGGLMDQSRQTGGTVQTSRIDFKMPDGKMDFTMYSYYPGHSKPFVINYPLGNGQYASKRFASIKEYNRWTYENHGFIMDTDIYPPGTFSAPKPSPGHSPPVRHTPEGEGKKGSSRLADDERHRREVEDYKRRGGKITVGPKGRRTDIQHREIGAGDQSKENKQLLAKDPKAGRDAIAHNQPDQDHGRRGGRKMEIEQGIDPLDFRKKAIPPNPPKYSPKWLEVVIRMHGEGKIRVMKGGTAKPISGAELKAILKNPKRRKQLVFEGYKGKGYGKKAWMPVDGAQMGHKKPAIKVWKENVKQAKDSHNNDIDAAKALKDAMNAHQNKSKNFELEDADHNAWKGTEEKKEHGTYQDSPPPGGWDTY